MLEYIDNNNNNEDNHSDSSNLGNYEVCSVTSIANVCVPFTSRFFVGIDNDFRGDLKKHGDENHPALLEGSADSSATKSATGTGGDAKLELEILRGGSPGGRAHGSRNAVAELEVGSSNNNLNSNDNVDQSKTPGTQNDNNNDMDQAESGITEGGYDLIRMFMTPPDASMQLLKTRDKPEKEAKQMLDNGQAGVVDKQEESSSTEFSLALRAWWATVYNPALAENLEEAAESAANAEASHDLFLQATNEKAATAISAKAKWVPYKLKQIGLEGADYKEFLHVLQDSNLQYSKRHNNDIRFMMISYMTIL
jgi:hypothetical protein